MEQLNYVEERLAIQELVHRYAIHLDLKEVEDWVAVFTEDGVFDERAFDSPLSTGHDEIRAYGNTLVEMVQYAFHHMTTNVVNDLTATSARGTAFAICEYLTNDGFHARLHVIYQDRYEKVDGRWLIAERVLRRTLPIEVMEEGSSPALRGPE